MSHNAELIAVGTELLLGNIANTDAQMLSKGLSALGINVFYHTVVGDNPERLKAAVALAKTRADIIITTGGLGPTCDDLTKNVLAECFGKKLVYDEESAARIRAYFDRLHTNRPMTENNLQQAYLPEGCTILSNDWGTAPGCAFEADGVHVIMLPGPPSECAPMFEHRAAPYLRSLSDGTIASRTLRIFGMGESSVEARLRDRMNSMQNPTLAPYAKTGEVELRITAKADTLGEAQALIAPVEKELCEMFGPLVYGADVDSLEQVVAMHLKLKGLTLGCAESCTGGLAAKRMTDLPGASAVFKGGVVSYTNEVKQNVLGVPQALLEEYGAVSEQVAAAMARGARKVLGCDLALAVTGVAGPDPDDRGNPVGLVYVALAAPDGVRVRTLHQGMGRERIRITSASHAFDMARRWLTGLPDGE
ncbi:competence/damage-inducible protein A [Lawsonibacter faecis]|uniref:Putative competence-damage inducible protein n=1 Tax=Lawsonibacter faecis TaxID=2763052 RepID=A0A8J6J8V9_9FIRM|nr:MULTISPECIES: competence/damage-inducible protein A [Oscillospiraceae]MTQ95479.1 competence/damage-inducible protein A [Pseudoflavonifractor sp. BIOML-A16]MTR05359.1 competence/damage-inducible protein A [Pseudoflavonifractor sp. BIOML-A15]MTR73237.1 competence/damage-inducible protein A [Pseudoflavonifractor sp. BIOML-A18]MTS71967.1 competence/damage-inducible protein A [Pseudoflavonifractor sp. BIOML-A8]MBC5738157.1 competence/damage-inducible protein A [Lawsonibacter faecis]